MHAHSYYVACDFWLKMLRDANIPNQNKVGGKRGHFYIRSKRQDQVKET